MNNELKKIFGDSITAGGVKVPTAHLRYKGKSDTYVIWTIIDESPQFFADDEANFSVFTVDVDVYSTKNYLPIVAEIKKIMKENDWSWVEDSPEMYEEDSKTYHKTITFEKGECYIMASTGLKCGKYNQIDTSTNNYKAIASEEKIPKFGKLIDAKLSVETNSAELYADDVLSESDYSFKKGTLTVTVDDDRDTVCADLLGNTITEDGEVTQSTYDSAPELGYGEIVKKKVDGVEKYKVEFFPRIKVNKITTDRKTRSGGSEFLTTTIESTVYPLDNEINGMSVGTWEKHQTFDTLAAAESYLDSCLTPPTV